VEHEVAPYVSAGDGRRLTLTGEDLQLPPKHALAIGLSLHELATNAVKYGALSVETGRIEVSWQVRRHAEGRVLEMKWAEMGGPPVEPPSRRGFGSRLIDRSIRTELQGTVEPDFLPSGLRVTIRIPLPQEHPPWDAAGPGIGEALGQNAA
jgi:two-component sensor histidine kinase